MDVIIWDEDKHSHRHGRQLGPKGQSRILSQNRACSHVRLKDRRATGELLDKQPVKQSKALGKA